MDDHLRASDADRDHAAEQLRAHYVAGRLSRDELDDRLADVLGSATRGALSRVLADLPELVPVRAEDVRLERRYRRLLALYPASYRRVHEEEMLAVLMTAAAAGQDRPGLADAADLVAGAMRVRCQVVLMGRFGWRGAAVLAGTGAVLGLLAGIPFATVSRPLPSASVTIWLRPQQSTRAAGGQLKRQLALADSSPVLGRAARALRPAMSEPALRQHVQDTLTTGYTTALDPATGQQRVVKVDDAQLTIQAQASTARQAESAATAVADSYVRAAPPEDIAQCAPSYNCSLVTVLHSGVAWQLEVLHPVLAAPAPGNSDIGEAAALGALAGALAGASAAAALTTRRRRYRAA